MYNGRINIPESMSGTWKIKHKTYPIGHMFDLSNNRTQILGGDFSKPIGYDRPTKWHSLLEGDSVWMTDLPIEQHQHEVVLKETYGVIVVGGLGLGIFSKILENKDNINKVIVVEKSKDVIKLVWKHLNLDERFEVINDDIFHYLNVCNKRFNWAFFDIWTSDGEGTFFEVVCKLYETCRENSTVIKDDRILNWNENVMRGQLIYGLQNRSLSFMGKMNPLNQDLSEIRKLLTTVNGSVWIDWSVPFFINFDKLENLEGAIMFYSGIYGKWHWKDKWEEYIKS